MLPFTPFPWQQRFAGAAAAPASSTDGRRGAMKTPQAFSCGKRRKRARAAPSRAVRQRSYEARPDPNPTPNPSEGGHPAGLPGARPFIPGSSSSSSSAPLRAEGGLRLGPGPGSRRHRRHHRGPAGSGAGAGRWRCGQGPARGEEAAVEAAGRRGAAGRREERGEPGRCSAGPG